MHDTMTSGLVSDGDESFTWGNLQAEDLLVCALCRKYFQDPRVLKCDHTFCRTCLQAYFDKRQAKYGTRIATMPCPTCQNRVHLPLIGISGLPLDHRIKRAKEVFISELMEDVKHRPPVSEEELMKAKAMLAEEEQKAREAELAKLSKDSGQTQKKVTSSVDEPDSTDHVKVENTSTIETEDTTPIPPPRTKRGRSLTRKSDLVNGKSTDKDINSSVPGTQDSGLYSAKESSKSPAGDRRRSSTGSRSGYSPPREPSPFSVVRDAIWSDFSAPPRDFEYTSPKPSTPSSGKDPTWKQFPSRRNSLKSPKSPKRSPTRRQRSVDGASKESSPFSSPVTGPDDAGKDHPVKSDKQKPRLDPHEDTHTSPEAVPRDGNDLPKDDTSQVSFSPEVKESPSELNEPHTTTRPANEGEGPLFRSDTEPDLPSEPYPKPKMRDKSKLLAQDKERPRSHASLLEPHMEDFSFTGLKRSNSDRLRSRYTQELEDDILKGGQPNLPTTSRSSRFVRKNSRRFKVNRNLNEDGKQESPREHLLNGRHQSPFRVPKFGAESPAFSSSHYRSGDHDPNLPNYTSDPDAGFHSESSGTSTPTYGTSTGAHHFPSRSQAESPTKDFYPPSFQESSSRRSHSEHRHAHETPGHTTFSPGTPSFMESDHRNYRSSSSTRKSRFSNKRPEGPTFEEEFAANMGGAKPPTHEHNFRTTKGDSTSSGYTSYTSHTPPFESHFRETHTDGPSLGTQYRSSRFESNFSKKHAESPHFHSDFGSHKTDPEHGAKTSTSYFERYATGHESPNRDEPRSSFDHDKFRRHSNYVPRSPEMPPQSSPFSEEKKSDAAEEPPKEEDEGSQPYKPNIRKKKTHFAADTNNNNDAFSSPYGKDNPASRRWSVPAYAQLNANSPLIDKYLRDSDEEEEQQASESVPASQEGENKVESKETEESAVDGPDGGGNNAQGDVIFQLMSDEDEEVILEEREVEVTLSSTYTIEGERVGGREENAEVGEVTLEVETEFARIDEEPEQEDKEEHGEEEEDEQEEEESEEEEESPEPIYQPPEQQWVVEKMDHEQPTALAVLSDGKVVVADYSHSQLQFYDGEGNFEFQLDGLKPYSVAVDHSGHVLVGDRKNKTVKTFDEFGADVAEWPENILDWVSGIALLSDGTIVVLDRQYCKVKLFNPQGDHLSEFGSYGTRDKQLSMADFIAVDSKDRIIICDSGNHCVKVFDRDGKFLLRFGCRGKKKGELQWPKGVCVDDKDNIIVADTKNNRVCMFSPDGDYIQRVVKDISNPFAVSFSKPNQLGVTQFALNGESEFKVFKIDQIEGDLSANEEL